MKKFFGVVVAVVLCVCMMAPAALAAEETDVILDGIVGLIEGAASEDSSDVLGQLGLGELDLSGIIGSIVEEDEAKDEVDAQVKAEEAIQDAQDTVEEKSGLDLSWLTTILGENVDADAVSSVFADFDEANMPDLLAVISESIGTAGIDMANFDASTLGSFDISTLLGGADDSAKPSGTATDVADDDSSMASTDLVTGIMDGLRGGLNMLGLDADALLASMGDSDIINFFANMYIGFIGEVETETSVEETPDTGDTASVSIALATLGVATVAAGVCLKKKED